MFFQRGAFDEGLEFGAIFEDVATLCGAIEGDPPAASLLGERNSPLRGTPFIRAAVGVVLVVVVGPPPTPPEYE